MRYRPIRWSTKRGRVTQPTKLIEKRSVSTSLYRPLLRQAKPNSGGCAKISLLLIILFSIHPACPRSVYEDRPLRSHWPMFFFLDFLSSTIWFSDPVSTISTPSVSQVPPYSTRILCSHPTLASRASHVHHSKPSSRQGRGSCFPPPFHINFNPHHPYSNLRTENYLSKTTPTPIEPFRNEPEMFHNPPFKPFTQKS